MGEQLELFEEVEYQASREGRLSFARKETANYKEFTDKFKPTNGSDECYTPKDIFDKVYKYVIDTYHPEGENIRPFKPNGDFTAEDYTNKFVVDNPPFSILCKIVQWYNERDIKYFLFCSHLHTLQAFKYSSCIICNAKITYSNGANVSTDFVTNMATDRHIELNGKLRQLLNEKPPKKKIEMYPFVLSSARLGKYIPTDSTIINIDAKDTLPILANRYKVFGCGVYIREGCIPQASSEGYKEIMDGTEQAYMDTFNFTPSK